MNIDRIKVIEVSAKSQFMGDKCGMYGLISVYR